VLGYKQITEHPTEWNLVQEQKTRFDATRPDGSLGFFTKDSSDTRVIIELKSADTDLDAKQHRKHDKRSPVEQAFSYVPKSGKKCDWIIVSNYVELRFYHKNSLGEYESFRIADLTDEAEFKRFYYLLSIENLIAKDGESVIDALYRRSEEEEKNISKKFYAEYTQARLHLFEHIKQKNPGSAGVSPEIPLLGGVRGGFLTLPGNELLLLEKTQKLLDRFIFVCFCEDTGMLPARIFRKVVKHAQESFAFTEDKIWREVKGLFRAIDQGSPAHGIHGFDGELFKPDPALDALHIGDDIFHELANITDYDFDSDLNVNILGHIFEQSISDLEELRAGIEGKEIDRKQGKRKKEGIFYTPEYITRYIVENAVGGWLEDRKQELGFDDLPELTEEDYASVKQTKSGYKGNKKIEQHRVFWDVYKEKLMNIKVLDPACGSGAFLNQAFDFLYKEGQRVNDALAALNHGQKTIFDLDRHILSNNLYGVDLNRESVEITKLSLWLKTANKHSQLTALDDNIKCGNSLIDDPAVAGEKAFKWDEGFPVIMQDGGFDVVIGNPPYGATLIKAEKIFFTDKYETAQYNFDTYIFFMELSFRLVRNDSYVGLTTPNTYLVTENSVRIRKLLFIENTIVNLLEAFNVFPDAVVEPIVSIFKFAPPESSHSFNVLLTHRAKDDFSQKLSGAEELIFHQQDLSRRTNFIFNYREKPEERGILDKVYKKSKRVIHHCNVTAGVKPYENGKGVPPQTKDIVKNKPFNSFEKKGDDWKPVVRGTDINRYLIKWGGEYIKYGHWLAAPRKSENFSNSKLFMRRTDDNLMAAFDDQGMIGINSVHCIQTKPDFQGIDLRYILALLNSKLLNWVFRHENFHMVGKPLAEVKVVFVERLPMIISTDQSVFIEKADKMLELNNRFHESTKKFLRFIESSYSPKKLSTRLNTFYTLSFNDFVKELKKQKVSLPKQDEFELMDLFEAQKAKTLSFRQEINQADKEIDRMMYELYDLTEEEIRIVEGKSDQ